MKNFCFVKDTMKRMKTQFLQNTYLIKKFYPKWVVWEEAHKTQQ